MLDYYIEAEDTLGNIEKSDIYHVWIEPKEGKVEKQTFLKDIKVKWWTKLN